MRKTITKIMGIALLTSIMFTCSAYASGDIALISAGKNTAMSIMKLVLSVSSIAAGVGAAIALVQLLVLQNPQKIDAAKSWLIRIIVVYVVMNGIGTILSFVNTTAQNAGFGNSGITSIQRNGQ